MRLIPSITNLETNASLNAKINEIKGEIPSITNLATTSAHTTVENEIRNVIELVKKAYHHADIKDIKSKYLTKFYYNKFTNYIFDEKIIAKKFVNESGLNKKIETISNKRRNEQISNKRRIKSRARQNSNTSNI